MPRRLCQNIFLLVEFLHFVAIYGVSRNRYRHCRIMRNFDQSCDSSCEESCDSHFKKPANPVSSSTMRNRLFPLKSYEFIKISGTDSVSFLQGQLSCNTELLSPQRSLTGALCNLKGRVIADFRLLQQGEHYLMQCAEGMAAEIVHYTQQICCLFKGRDHRPARTLTRQATATPIRHLQCLALWTTTSMQHCRV